MDDLDIIKEVVEIRDAAEEKVFVAALFEGIIAFLIIMFGIIMISLNNGASDIIVIFALFLLYGLVMKDRLDKIFWLRKIRKRIKKIGDDDE